MRIGLYAGSFDPITRGHLDVLQKAMKTFDHVHIAIGTNPAKTRLFPVQQSVDLIHQAIRDLTGSSVLDGLSIGEFTDQGLANYAREIKATHVVRGLRQVSDFNEEFGLHGVVMRQDPNLLMAYFMCREEFLHVSSSTARALAKMNEPDLTWLVTPSVERALREKFQNIA